MLVLVLVLALVPQSLSQNCPSSIVNMITGTGATQPANFQCLQVQTRTKTVILRGEWSSVAGSGVIPGNGTVLTSMTACSAAFDPQGRPTAAVNVTSITVQKSGATDYSFVTPAMGGVMRRNSVACVCVGFEGSPALRVGTGPAQGQPTRTYGSQEELVLVNWGSFNSSGSTALSSLALTLLPNTIASSSFYWGVSRPIVSFADQVAGDIFTGFYPIYRLPPTGPGYDVVLVNVTRNAAGDPELNNLDAFSSKVTVRVSSASPSTMNYTMATTDVTWVAGDIGVKSVPVMLGLRSNTTAQSAIEVITIVMDGSTSSTFTQCVTSSSTPLRIWVSGCDGNGKCSGGGDCTASSQTSPPSCNCRANYQPTGNGGDCVAVAALVSSTPLFPQPSTFPRIPEWQQRTVTVSNSASGFKATSKGPTSEVAFATAYATGSDLRFRSSSSTSTLRFRVAAVAEFRDANGNHQLDAGEITQVARMGLDGRPGGALGQCCVSTLPSPGTSWSTQDFAPPSTPGPGGRTDVRVDRRIYPTDLGVMTSAVRFGSGSSSDMSRAFPPSQMFLQLEVQDFPYKSTDKLGKLAALLVFDSSAVPTLIQDVSKAYNALGPMAQVKAGDQVFTIPTWLPTADSGYGTSTYYRNLPVYFSGLMEINDLPPELAAAANALSSFDDGITNAPAGTPDTTRRVMIVSFDVAGASSVSWSPSLGLVETIDTGSSFGPDGFPNIPMPNSTKSSAPATSPSLLLALLAIVFLAQF